jgi:hypothetical protein
MADYIIVMRKNNYTDDYKPVTTNGERFCDYKGSSMCAPKKSDLYYMRNEEEYKISLLTKLI